MLKVSGMRKAAFQGQVLMQTSGCAPLKISQTVFSTKKATLKRDPFLSHKPAIEIAKEISNLWVGY